LDDRPVTFYSWTDIQIKKIKSSEPPGPSRSNQIVLQDENQPQSQKDEKNKAFGGCFWAWQNSATGHRSGRGLTGAMMLEPDSLISVISNTGWISIMKSSAHFRGNFNPCLLPGRSWYSHGDRTMRNDGTLDIAGGPYFITMLTNPGCIGPQSDFTPILSFRNTLPGREFALVHCLYIACLMIRKMFLMPFWYNH